MPRLRAPNIFNDLIGSIVMFYVHWIKVPNIPGVVFFYQFLYFEHNF